MMNNGYSNRFSMKWHNFLIYFSLWAGGIINIFSSFRYFSGTVYGANSNQVYYTYPSMKTIDMLMGVCLVGAGIFALITRFSLAGFKKKAPSYLLIYYFISLLVQIGYVILASSVTHLSISELGGSQLWSSIVVSIAFLIANKVYYDKRISLFRN